MKKELIFLTLLFTQLSAHSQISKSSDANKAAVSTVIDSWHKAAAEAKFDQYFSLMTNDAVFIGTDPTENWHLSEFKAYAKPYFDKGKAWSFKSFQRNIYFNKEQNLAWFDELLDTQMKICRGSGILKKENGKWKIAQYVLSMTIPNKDTEKVVEMKAAFDNTILNQFNNYK